MIGTRSERHLILVALAGGVPALILAIVLLGLGGLQPALKAALGVAVTLAWLSGAYALRHAVAFRLRTISNLLAALREGDYSFRVRGGRRSDAFGELVLELNALAQTLRGQRFGEIEATALLGMVMGEIDVAVLVFDPERRLRLANPAAARLLGGIAAEGTSAQELRLGETLEGPPARTVSLRLPGGTGHFELRRGAFRQLGRRHDILVLSDVSRALRAEEVAAWRRIIRVLGHELNNSLAPIKSIAASLGTLVAREPLPADWQTDVSRGLEVIASRAEALNRLMSAYAKLAKLPQPTLAPLPVGVWVRRVVGLETRLAVAVDEGPEVVLRADGDQLDQVLINLVRNAVDAIHETGGGVRVGWRVRPRDVEVWVEDEGPGLASTDNLFVPFFTTKPGGAGIGLALSRQIVEAHGGAIEVANRLDRRGCRALVRLPLKG